LKLLTVDVCVDRQIIRAAERNTYQRETQRPSPDMTYVIVLSLNSVLYNR